LSDQAATADVLRRADEMKSALLSSVSHDLRSPLTAIKAAVGALREPGMSWSNDDRDALLGTIESQTDRLTRTVSDLLDLSRIEGGATKPAIEPVDVAALLDDAGRAAAQALGDHELTLQAPEALYARADEALLRQALGNLLENAGRYATPGSAVHLRAERAGPLVRIEVADEGPGIPPDELPHIFDRFYRGRMSKGTSGSGLGLAIVRTMVEASGGRVSVESSPAGTCFVITMPLQLAPR
jgi:two-component system sensor histidine kinase KdpD